MLLGSRNYFTVILVIGFLMLAYQFRQAGFSENANHDEFVKRDSPISVKDVASSPDIEPPVDSSTLPEIKNSLDHQLGSERKPPLDSTNAKRNNSSPSRESFSDAILKDIVHPELERRRKASKEIENRFQVEERVEQWASARESEITDLVYSSDYLMSLSPHLVECKTTTCVVIFSASEIDSNTMRETSHKIFKQVFNADESTHNNIHTMKGHIAADLNKEGFNLYLYEGTEE